MLNDVLHRSRVFAAFIRDSSRCLKGNSNLQWMMTLLRNGIVYTALLRRGTEEAKMGRTEFAAVESGSIGEASEDVFFRLGMMYSTGTEVPTDYVSAHKWFNLAATRGNAGAIRLRREIATEMTDAEIAQAQRAARDWLKN
jgi:TPR repeat protein